MVVVPFPKSRHGFLLYLASYCSVCLKDEYRGTPSCITTYLVTYNIAYKVKPALAYRQDALVLRGGRHVLIGETCVARVTALKALKAVARFLLKF